MSEQNLVPPVADVRPHSVTHHGRTLTDDYEWMRDKESQEVIDHLTAENAYTDAVTADQQPLREAIFNEIKFHTVETDLSVPVRRFDWWYFTRTQEGSQYALSCRVPAQDTGDEIADWTPPEIEPGVTLDGEQVLLDGNVEAEGKPFFSLGGMAITPDGNTLAYLVDNTGNELYSLRIRDITPGGSGEDRAEGLDGLFSGITFDRTGTRIIYTLPDESWRPYQLKVHTLGTDSSTDVLLHEETDASMWASFGKSADRQDLIIALGTSERSETRILPLPESAEEPLPEPRVLVDRSLDMLHEVSPLTLRGERSYLILHNKDAAGQHLPNNQVSLATEATLADPAAWVTVIPHSATTKLDDIDVTRDQLIVSGRKNTTPRSWFIALEGLGTAGQHEPVEPEFPEELYTSSAAATQFEAPLVRFGYGSWVTPAQIMDYNPATRELYLRKSREVPNYDPTQYLVERWWAPAESTNRKVAIPLTVIRHKDVEWNGENPCVIYGYGSYEVSMDPGLTAGRLSLLDRGVVFVVAHVRGGGELGRLWYENGKKLHKKNSFTDFVDATRFVAQSGWVHPDRIAAMGGSAGGLLMGAVLNLAPELYRAVLAQVPFVDPLTSILNPDLPLTTLEWDEWGNPLEDPEVYDYMASYAPYLNVREVDYPAIAAVTSLHDTRVLYVEPTKWVQQLRRTATSDQSTPLAEGGAPIVQKTEMDGGHGGASGRYKGWEDLAWDYAFLLTALGVTE